jgi:hypothetical protein
VSADSTSLDLDVPLIPESLDSNWYIYSIIAALFRRRATGPIALDSGVSNLLEIGTGTSSSFLRDGAEQIALSRWEVPPELTEVALHWSMLGPDWRTSRALWITTSSTERARLITHALPSLIVSPSGEDGTRIALVDLSEIRSAFWTLARGLAIACPRYRAELGNTPSPWDVHFAGIEKIQRRLGCGQEKPDVSPWRYYNNRGVS